MPFFLDFEASSLSENSYPIEVAWGSDTGEIESYLISPEGIASWSEEDYTAQHIHGIGYRELLEEGESPAAICKRMNLALAGKKIYTDAARYDTRWLTRLFAAAGIKSAAIHLEEIDELLLDIVSPLHRERAAVLESIEALKSAARMRAPLEHRAAWDVQYLIELWKLAIVL